MSFSSETAGAGYDRASLLSKSAVFAGLSACGLESLAELSRPKVFLKGEEIFVQNQPARHLYLVVTGRVKMWRPLASGRSLVLALFHPGELFGAAATLAGEPCDASASALESSTCLEIDRDDVYALFERRPELISEILPVLTRQMVECRNCIVEYSCFRVEKRFAHLLLKLAETAGQAGGDGIVVPIQLSRQELADMTGTTIETSIRIMSRWSKQGVVETRAGGFLIRDRGVLEELTRA